MSFVCRSLVFLFSASLLRSGIAPAQVPAPSSTPAKRDEPMVDVAVVCPTISIELRYSTARNLTGAPLYPANARCLVRQSVAARLQRAQTRLLAAGFSLKIWDAYRPAWVQYLLWEAVRNPEFVGDPARGGSHHTRGVAVDVTLVDMMGQEAKMPTDFDDFTPAAKRKYAGADPVVATNLKLLQETMAAVGFRGLRDEWWHFVAEDAAHYAPVELPLGAEIKP